LTRARSDATVVLGIETSCDDTAAAVVGDGVVRSSVVSSQDAIHSPFGGVVPELASREHLRNILPVIDDALARAGVSIDGIDAIAVTRGPGLMGSLLVGLAVAKGIALVQGVPLVAVNHLEGHLLSVLLERDVPFPFLALLVSGGHTSLYLARSFGEYSCVGRTVDDAVGEAFDKAAKILGLGYPGGRAIDALARDGDPGAVRFPRARVKHRPHDFSFSGVKTAVRQHVAAGRAAPLADVAASLQEALVDVLVHAALSAAAEYEIPRLVVAGGVSANSRLRDRLTADAVRHGVDVVFPSPRLCTDNAAMIAYAGWRRIAGGGSDPLDVEAEAQLALESGRHA
jgi:N6-L-threonylcarbamoyladenine synthase